ncbi:hypothetical protein DFJ74DRAFT_659531 [Hyaloraphidium curvatum]|nr:hypothetical protein DFJ74DRAFT_659531 [Hyaloraphidium curvatum]
MEPVSGVPAAPSPASRDTRIEDLPRELLLDIFSLVGRNDLLPLSLTGRCFSEPALAVLWTTLDVNGYGGLFALFEVLLEGLDRALLFSGDEVPPDLYSLFPEATLARFSRVKHLCLSKLSFERIAHWPDGARYREFEAMVDSIAGDRGRISPSIDNAEYILAKLFGILLLACNRSLVSLKVPVLSGRYLKNEISDLLGSILLSEQAGAMFPNLLHLDLTPSLGINDGVLHMFLSLSRSIVHVDMVCVSVPGITRGTFPTAFLTSGIKLTSLTLHDRRYNSTEIRETAVAELVDVHSETLERLDVEGIYPDAPRLLSPEPGAGIKRCSRLKHLALSLEKFDFSELHAADDPTNMHQRFESFLRSPDLPAAFPVLRVLKLTGGLGLSLAQLHRLLSLYGRQLTDLDLEDYARARALMSEDDEGPASPNVAWEALGRDRQIRAVCSHLSPSLRRLQADGSVLASNAAVDALAESAPNPVSLNLSNPLTSRGSVLDSRCLPSLARFANLHRLTLLQPIETVPILGESAFPFGWLPFLSCLRTLFFEGQLCHALLSENATHEGDLLMALAGDSGRAAALRAGIDVGKQDGTVAVRRRRDVLILDWQGTGRGKSRFGRAGSCEMPFCKEEDAASRLFGTG